MGHRESGGSVAMIMTTMRDYELSCNLVSLLLVLSLCVFVGSRDEYMKIKQRKITLLDSLDKIVR